MLDSIVNLDLLAHPYNWIIVILILAIAAMGMALLSPQLGQLGGIVKVA